MNEKDLTMRINKIKIELDKKEKELNETMGKSGLVDFKLAQEVKNLRRERYSLLNKRAKYLAAKEARKEAIKKPEVVKLEEKEVEEEKPRIENLNVKFYSKSGRYYFNFDENIDGKTNNRTKIYVVEKKMFDDELKENKRLAKTLGIDRYNELDLNLINALSQFDEEFETNLKEDYINSKMDFNITYDLRGKNKNLSKTENKVMLNRAKSQTRFDNATLKRYPAKVATIVAGIGLIGVLALNGIGVKAANKKTNYSNKTKIESSVQNDNYEKMSTVKTEEKKKELFENKLTPDDFHSKADKKIDHYKISLIAIMDGNSVVDMIKVANNKFLDFDKIKSKYEEKCLNPVSLSVNFNGYNKKGKLVKNNIGWTNLDKIVENGKKLVKAL